MNTAAEIEHDKSDKVYVFFLAAAGICSLVNSLWISGVLHSIYVEWPNYVFLLLNWSDAIAALCLLAAVTFRPSKHTKAIPFVIAWFGFLMLMRFIWFYSSYALAEDDFPEPYIGWMADVLIVGAMIQGPILICVAALMLRFPHRITIPIALAALILIPNLSAFVDSNNPEYATKLEEIETQMQEHLETLPRVTSELEAEEAGLTEYLLITGEGLVYVMQQSKLFFTDAIYDSGIIRPTPATEWIIFIGLLVYYFVPFDTLLRIRLRVPGENDGAETRPR